MSDAIRRLELKLAGTEHVGGYDRRTKSGKTVHVGSYTRSGEEVAAEGGSLPEIARAIRQQHPDLPLQSVVRQARTLEARHAKPANPEVTRVGASTEAAVAALSKKGVREISMDDMKGLAERLGAKPGDLSRALGRAGIRLRS
jgi:hypothetical protein